MRHTTQHALRYGRGAAAPYINAILIATTVAGTLSISLAAALAGTEVRVEQDNNVVVQTDKASIREILDTLSGKFNLTYKIPPNLDRVRTGLY